MSSQDFERDVSPPKKPPVGGVNMMPGIGAALKGRRGIEAPAGVGVQTDRESGVGVIRQSTTGMIRKDSDKDRIKSTSLSNLLAPEMSAAGAGEPSNAPPDKRRMTQEVSGVSDASVLDVVRATHAYKAEFEDELAFEAGDIIEVLEKKSEDEGWWRGRIKGTSKVGLFPDNFVGPFVRESVPSNDSVADAGGVTTVDGNMIGKVKEKASLAQRPAPTVHPKPSRPPPPVHPKPPAGVLAPAPTVPVSSIPTSVSSSNVVLSAAAGGRDSRPPETPSLDDVSVGVVPLQHIKKPGGPQGRRLPTNASAPPVNSNSLLPNNNNNLLEIALRSQQQQQQPPQPQSPSQAPGGEAEGSKISVPEKRLSFPPRGVPVFPPAPSGDASSRKSNSTQAPSLNVSGMSSSMYAPANSNGGPVLTAPPEHVKLQSHAAHASSYASGTSHAPAGATASGGDYVTREEYDRDMNKLRAEIVAMRTELDSLKRNK